MKSTQKKILGQDPTILLALWANILSWLVQTFAPSLLTYLLPKCEEEEEQEPGGDNNNNNNNNNNHLRTGDDPIYPVMGLHWTQDITPTSWGEFLLYRLLASTHTQLSRPMTSGHYILDSGRPRQHNCVPVIPLRC